MKQVPTIIFDKGQLERDDAIKMSIVRIMNIVETYLTTIINAGKKDQTFKTSVTTKLLVNRILIGFRMFMKDEQLVNEMILELTTLKKQNNDEGY